MRGDDKVVPAMVELAKKRSEGVEDFDYMIGHTNIPQKDDLIKACRKAFGKDPLITFPLGGVVSANTGPDTIALVYVATHAEFFLRTARRGSSFCLQAVAFCGNLCYTPFAVLLRGNLKEQLRILGSPACLEPCRAKPIGWRSLCGQNSSAGVLL